MREDNYPQSATQRDERLGVLRSRQRLRQLQRQRAGATVRGRGAEVGEGWKVCRFFLSQS